MLTRCPEASVGQNLANAPLFRHLAVAPSGAYIAASVIDGDDRTFGYAAVGKYPLAGVEAEAPNVATGPHELGYRRNPSPVRAIRRISPFIMA